MKAAIDAFNRDRVNPAPTAGEPLRLSNPSASRQPCLTVFVCSHHQAQTEVAASARGDHRRVYEPGELCDCSS